MRSIKKQPPDCHHRRSRCALDRVIVIRRGSAGGAGRALSQSAVRTAKSACMVRRHELRPRKQLLLARKSTGVWLSARARTDLTWGLGSAPWRTNAGRSWSMGRETATEEVVSVSGGPLNTYSSTAAAAQPLYLGKFVPISRELLGARAASWLVTGRRPSRVPRPVQRNTSLTGHILLRMTPVVRIGWLSRAAPADGHNKICLVLIRLTHACLTPWRRQHRLE